MLLTAEQIKDRSQLTGYEMVKYARMEDGSFRFCEVFVNHSTMLTDGESRGDVRSAGTLVIKDDGLHWEGRGSLTLGTDAGDCLADEARMEELFGLLFAGPY